MKILQVNKYYYLRGGSERYLFEISSLLENAGHEVIPFSMASERNEPSPFAEFFIPEIDYRKRTSPAEGLRRAGKVIWNREAYRKVRELAERFQPDIAHLHNIAHQLSGSVIAALNHAGVPVVQSLHDCKPICPAYRRFRDGKPCDSCLRYRYWEAVRHKCVMESRAASLVAATESAFYAAIGLYRKGVRLFHAPSLFMKKTMERWGFPPEQIVHFLNTISLDGYDPSYEDDGSFLFMGRLSHEKGLPVLLDAAERMPDAEILIAGEGPEMESLVAEVERRSIRSIHFLGYLGGKELKARIRNCRALLLPSEYDDNSPTVIYESFAFGKPVIGAERGGIPEMVVPGETGFLFPSSDSVALATAIEKLADDPGLARKLGREGRHRMETVYGPEAHLKTLLDFYRKAIEM